MAIPPQIVIETPRVVWWFKFYCGFLAFIYLSLIAFSLFLLFGELPPGETSEDEARFLGGIFLFLGSILFIACLTPFFASPRPWVWIYDLVIIGLGMTSACFLPVCVPLLVFWLKPETKKYFGYSDL